ncbi:hypothetical protein H5410_023931, partial [Solanum commersonii]
CPIFEGISTDDAHAPSFNILAQTPPSKTVHFRQPCDYSKSKGKKRKGKKHVETPPGSDSDSYSNFLGQTKKKKTKKATKVKVAETSKPYIRRKTKRDEPELPKSKKPKKVVK